MPSHTRFGVQVPGSSARARGTVQRWLAGVVAVLVAFGPLGHEARAADDNRTRAEKLIQEGLNFARAGKFRDAIPRFEEANKLYPHPETKHNLGRSHQELGELKIAYEYFQQALKQDYQFAADGRNALAKIEVELRKSYARLTVRTTPSTVNVVLTFPSGEDESHVTTPFQTWVPAGRTKLVGTNPAFKTGEQTLELAAGEDREVSLVLIPLPKQGFLQVSVSQPGATVTLSGRLAGKSPLAGMAWEVGAYELEVKLRGYVTHREQIVINADSVTSVNVTLLQDKGPNGNGTVDTGVPSWVGWTLVGTGVVAGGIAAYLQWGKAQPAQDAAEEALQLRNDVAEYDRQHEKALDFQLAAQVSMVFSIALMGTGAYLLIFEAGDDEAAASLPTFVPDIALTPDGGYVGGTFRF